MSNFEPNFESLITLTEAFSNVLYLDKDHSYEIDGKKLSYSVTKLLSKYKKPFDSDEMSRRVAAREGVTPEDVISKWDFTRDYANHKGTEFHLYVENYLERRKTVIDKERLVSFFKQRPEFYYNNSVDEYYKELAKMLSNFVRFYEWYKKDHIILKSEFVIGDKSAGLAGTLDNLSFNKKTNELVIFDYKTNKDIKMSNRYGDRLLYPLDHLDNCEFNIYSLQLWLYKLIIERNTPFRVGKCCIVWFVGDDYTLFDVANMEKEALMILNAANKDN